MCIRDRADSGRFPDCVFVNGIGSPTTFWRKPEIVRTTGLALERFETIIHPQASVSSFARLGYGCVCLLYTSDAADERSSVDLGGRRIIKKKKKKKKENLKVDKLLGTTQYNESVTHKTEKTAKRGAGTLVQRT